MRKLNTRPTPAGRKALSSYAQVLQSAIAHSGVTGASLAYWDGSTLHTATAGLRNSVTGDPVTPDTVMHVGSVTKIMNAVLVMQLVDEGRVTLEDPVLNYLPELRLHNKDAAGRISCGMLLNHTSGINGDWLPERGADHDRMVDLIERCAELDQVHAPGRATSYCNIGTVIAGYLVQKLRAKSWYAVVKEFIYDRLDMQHALVDPLEAPRFRCSVGDALNYADGKLAQTKRPFLASGFAPAGSTQMTSASDLVTFARALVNGGVGVNGSRLLSSAAAARMMQPTAAFAHPMNWQIGLGWMILPGGILNHAGGGRGVLSQLYADPSTGRAVALLTNCDRGGALHPAVLGPILDSWTSAKAPPPASTRRRMLVADTAPYVGVYENNLLRMEIFTERGTLRLHQDTNGREMSEIFDFSQSQMATLHLVGDNLFEVEYATPGAPGGEIRLMEPDSNGRMQVLATGFRLMRRASAPSPADTKGKAS